MNYTFIDVVHARRMRQQLAKIPNASIADRLEILFLDHNHVWIHGAYANHSGAGEYISDAAGENLLFLPDFGTGEVETPKSSTNVSRCYAQLKTDVESSINIHKYEVDVFSRDESTMLNGSQCLRRKMQNLDASSPPRLAETSSVISESPNLNGIAAVGVGNDKPQRDKATTDKSVMKKKWSQIGKGIASLISSVKSAYGGVSRSSLDLAHEHLSSAFSALPMPSDIVLGMDLDAQLQQDIPKVVDYYVQCKEWAGEVYDTLCPLALVTNEKTPCDFKKLKELLREGEGLPFRCVYEENQLKRVIKDIEELVDLGKAVLADATQAASNISQNFFETHVFKNEEEGGSSSGSSRSKGSSKASKRNLSAKDKEDLKLSNLLGM